MKMYRASRHDINILERDVTKVTANYVFFKDRIYERREAISGESHHYFPEKQDAINWLKERLRQEIKHAKARFVACEKILKKISEEYPD